MVSKSSDKTGLRVQFRYGGKHFTIRLGHWATERQADEVRIYVERLTMARRAGIEPCPLTLAWIAKCDKRVRRVLVSAELIEADPTTTVGGLLDYCQSQCRAKESTRRAWGVTAVNVLEFFGRARLLRTITAGRADEFRVWLGDQGLAAATVTKRCQQVRQWMGVAVRNRWLDSNPFAHQRGWQAANSDRIAFVATAEVLRVMEHLPGPEWRLLLALARWGGLRVPSETNLLNWRDVDWDSSTFVVHSPKTERVGKSERRVPIFPELRPYFVAVDLLPNTSRLKGSTIRGIMARAVKKSGITPWPKLFQNLRATRQTELAARFPLHVVSAWMGNTPRVAMAHYLHPTTEDYEKALTFDTTAGTGCVAAVSAVNVECFTGRREATV